MFIFIIIGLVFTSLAALTSTFLFIPASGRAPPKVAMMLCISVLVCLAVSAVALLIPVIIAPVYASCLRTNPSLNLMAGYWLLLTAFILCAIGLTIAAAVAALSSIYAVRIERAIRDGPKQVQVLAPTIPNVPPHPGISWPPTVAPIPGTVSSVGPVHPVNGYALPAPPPPMVGSAHAYTAVRGHGTVGSPHYVHPLSRSYADIDAATRMFE